jgi:hypothetical protein
MTTALKKGITISLVVLILSGCEFSLNGILEEEKVPRPNGTTPTETQQPPKFDSEKPITSIAPYYANGDIEYYKDIKELSKSTLLNQNIKDQIVSSYSSNWGNSKVEWTTVEGSFHFYEVGTIKAQTYKNKKLVVLQLDCDGPCFSPFLYRYAYDPIKNELILLERHSSEDYMSVAFVVANYQSNKSVLYKGIEPPQTISIPNSDKVLELQVAHNSYLPDDLTVDKFVFTDEQNGNLYSQSGSSCLRLKSPDGSTSLYGYNPHFFDSETITASWDDNSTSTNITENYHYVAGGCGITGTCYLTLPSITEDQLTKFGKTSNGIDLYTTKDPVEGFSIDITKASGHDPSKTSAKEDFDNYFQMYKNSYQYNTEAQKIPQMDFQTFINSKSVLYWKDPLNRWTGLLRADVTPPAECGKPVIYLYPEKTTDVSVQVDVDKFTKTIPAYGKTGWTVKADPDGTLYNYADKQTYPYLFWEGQESTGVVPTEGFSVHRDDLEQFLDESLTKLGLNSTELKDFKEFWLPRMLENDEEYFMISFLGTSEFNKVAPLTITPAPQTLIRVFMYYHPTNTDYEMTPQKLTTLPRKGFTVIEWGGTSSVPWQY